MTYNTINDAVTMQGGAEGALLAGRYRVVRQLGQGGMGSVWLAEDTQLDNKQFAIKMLPSILVSNKRAYRQLKAEALVAMKLVHPNIVTLRAFEENGGNPFLVMDYIDGETLDDYLAEREKLSEEETIRLLHPIATALDYAHSKGVVHRDVKPGNVMVAKDGTTYILDFGIAREIQETLTRVTGKLSSGTLLYMSPEQLCGQPPKPAQDVYSFAAMAYECLKGEPPFVRGAIEEQIKHIVPEPPAGHGAAFGDLVAGVMAGLAKTPEHRPASCAAVIEWHCKNERMSAKAAGLRIKLGAERCVVALKTKVMTPSSADGKESAKSHEVDRPRASKRIEFDSGGRMALLIVAILAVFACGGYFRWMMRHKMQHQDVAGAAKQVAVKRPVVDEKHKVEERRQEDPRLAKLCKEIGSKLDGAETKMREIAAFRGETAGFKSHIDNADKKWNLIHSVERNPSSVAAAERILEEVSKAVSVIGDELDWLRAKWQARDEAKAIEADIVMKIDPELKRYNENNFDDIVRSMYNEGSRLRNDGNIALLNGDFAGAKQKLAAARAKFFVFIESAKQSVDYHIYSADNFFKKGNMKPCVDECDKVLRVEPNNARAKELKGEANIKIVAQEKEKANQDDQRKKSIDSYMHYAQKYFQRNSWESCVNECDHILRLDPDNVQAKQLKNEANRRIAEKKNQTASSRPSVYLTASINGVKKQATVFEGLDEKNLKTPVNVTVYHSIGTKLHFAAQLFENGVVYTGVNNYTSIPGRQDVDIGLKPLRNCFHCGSRLPFRLYEAKCPSCRKELMR